MAIVVVVKCEDTTKQDSTLSDEECRKVGFNKGELWCDRCSELNKFELDDLKPDCLKCCRDDDKISKKVFVVHYDSYPFLRNLPTFFYL